MFFLRACLEQQPCRNLRAARWLVSCWQSLRRTAMALYSAKDSSRLDAFPAKPPTPAWSELKRRFGWEWNGMRLHEVYFGNLTRKRTNLEKTAGLGAQLARDFGSHESTRRFEMSATPAHATVHA